MGVSAQAKFQKRDLELAQDFAMEHEDFDDTFILSLQVFFDERGYLTDKQYTALTNTIESWNMESWADREGKTYEV